MARSRNIKPSFFTNDSLSECSPLSRLLFIGLWTVADREGRLGDRPKKIKAEVLPYDDCDVNELLTQLHKHRMIHRYKNNGNDYIQIINFVKHQQPHYKEAASIIPAPDGWVDSGITAGGVPESVRQKILERDGKCVQCQSSDDLTLDHIIPRSQGGSHAECNLQTLCRKCNSSKNNRLITSSQSQANLEPTLSQTNRSVTPLFPLTDSLLLIPDSPIPHTETPSMGDFDVFWKAYPHKVGKGDAVKAFKTAIKKTSIDEILKAIHRYTQTKPPDRPYCNPSTWLNQERWNDEPAKTATTWQPKPTEQRTGVKTL